MTKIVYTNTEKTGIVDDDTPDYLLKKRWTCGSHGHLKGNFNGDILQLHRIIIGAKPGEIVDHINGNPLDNRRGNLRLVDKNQNSWNSRALGVTFCRNAWQAAICKRGKHYYIGRYTSFNEARDARVAYEKKLFGEYRREIDGVTEDMYWEHRRKQIAKQEYVKKKRGCRGERNARSIIREVDIPYIRHTKELSSSELAKKYGVSYSCIYLIKKRKLWAHVNDS